MSGLLLTVEMLLGRYTGTATPDDDTTDYPPTAARVFSALVAGWGGRNRNERRALEWLECQSCPSVLAPQNERSLGKATAYVPGAGIVTKHYTGVGTRSRHWHGTGRKFASSHIPGESPTLEYHWKAEPEHDTICALNSLAIRTPYVGTSHSPVRMHFSRAVASPGAKLSEAWVYPGRLDELAGAYDSGQRPVVLGKILRKEDVRDPGVRFRVVRDSIPGGKIPGGKAGEASEAFRRTLMSGFGVGAAPAALHGHGADHQERILVLPLPAVGSKHLKGHIVGFWLVPPAGKTLNDFNVVEAWRRVSAPYGSERVATLRRLAGEVQIAPLPHDSQPLKSLDTAPYLAEAKVWRTVTPMVLAVRRGLRKATDRRGRRRGSARDVTKVISKACRQQGYPEPKNVKVGTSVPGVCNLYNFRFQRYANQGLDYFHACVEFGECVKGPVVVGNGRYFGLGLMRSVR